VNMFMLYVEAPFAVFRTFTAGWYRPTATFLTPSAAYGLLLNVAGIESRLREEETSHDGKTPATLTKAGLPSAEVAVGVPEFIVRRGKVCPWEQGDPFPRVQTLFQQLHNYPVGKSGEERAESAKGNKYNITPVRREILSGLRAIIAMRGNDALADRVRRGLAGESTSGRYGIPFLGDNAFILDRLETISESGPVRWFERITLESDVGVRERATRLTLVIDRADLSRTTSALFAPQQCAIVGEPPAMAWSLVTPPGHDIPESPAGRPNRKKST
jgi:CRISPR-associated protein Cas5t